MRPESEDDCSSGGAAFGVFPTMEAAVSATMDVAMAMTASSEDAEVLSASLPAAESIPHGVSILQLISVLRSMQHTRRVSVVW